MPFKIELLPRRSLEGASGVAAKSGAWEFQLMAHANGKRKENERKRKNKPCIWWQRNVLRFPRRLRVRALSRSLARSSRWESPACFTIP